MLKNKQTQQPLIQVTCRVRFLQENNQSLAGNEGLYCNHPCSSIFSCIGQDFLTCSVAGFLQDSWPVVHCVWLSYSTYKTSSALAVCKTLSCVIISAHARTVSIDDLNYLLVAWSFQQEELPKEMPDTDRVFWQRINENISSVQI